MPKKATKKKEEVIVEVQDVCENCPKIEPLTEAFGNGDLNVLRDKINEIIAKR